MLDGIAIGCAVALAAAAGWFLRRRRDVVDYDRADVTRYRVGQTWIRSRHGGR